MNVAKFHVLKLEDLAGGVNVISELGADIKGFFSWRIGGKVTENSDNVVTVV